MGEKIFIADKETLDTVHNRIGESNDNNHTGNTSTLMGKLNYIVNTISNYVVGFANCKNRLDAKVSSRQSESDANSRFDTINSNTRANHSAYDKGNLSQKLSYIIDYLPSMMHKVLVSKSVYFSTTKTGTHTILEVNGGGKFELAHTSMGTPSEKLYIEIDDDTHCLEIFSGTAVIGQCKLYPDDLLRRLSNITDREYFTLHPIYFKHTLKITVEKTSSTEGFFHAQFAVYE